LVADALDLAMLPSAAYEEIVAQDVLEHFHWRDTPRALYEWNRLLQKDGTLRLRTTYVVGLAKRFTKPPFQDIATQKLLVANLFSMQLMPGDYHLTAFSERLIRYYLWETGYAIDDIAVRDDWLFEIIAHKICEFYEDDLLSADLPFSCFVQKAYRRLLGREPDDAGYNHWLAKLTLGEIDRCGLIKSILLSPEREDRMAANCPHFDLIFD
jgi:hypothetical protein